MNVGSSAPIDFVASTERSGFRLHRFELYNWGTFHNKVWSLRPNGDNTLVTGDIGSGKSTLVDAITTLLVPANRIIYNKAAGAETKERTLKSYVLGHYKTERSETSLVARPVGLRDHNSYSVILGSFYNVALDQYVTLAQVFWIKDGDGQPARFFTIADAPLSIAEHFSGFGSDTNDLKKRLRRLSSTEVYDNFPPYGAAFRRRFGIDNEQAMELFSQTVSMKKVENLTDFVRSHMLEPFAIEARIAALVDHFDDLNRAHEAILKAKAQIERLAPLVADCDRHAELSGQAGELRVCRDALKPWFAKLKGELLDKRRENLTIEMDRFAVRIAALTERRREAQVRRDEIKQAIIENGGDRIERLKTEIAGKQEDKKRRMERAEKYGELARALALPDLQDAETFLANRYQLQVECDAMQADKAQVENEHTEKEVEFRQIKRDHDNVMEEIASLRQRGSNLDSAVVAIRKRLCTELTLDAEDLSFAGELLQVREGEQDWEGACERLLRSFGLSLLVPDEQYAAVAAWVDRTQLRGRLVYYRVHKPQAGTPSSLSPHSLVRKLAIKPDSSFYRWLEIELARRFDYVCCDSLEQFRRERQAVTRAGQIKGGGERHEKDDRHRLDDRTRYILGWTNTAKIAALEKKSADLVARMQAMAAGIGQLQARRNRLDDRLRQASQLEMFADFRELDWRPLALEIERLEQDRERLERESDILRTLEHQLEEVEKILTESENELKETERDDAVTRDKHVEVIRLLNEAATILAALSPEEAARIFPKLDAMRTEVLGEQRFTVESCDNRQTDMREWLQKKKIDAVDEKVARFRDRIIDAMRGYKNDYPIETLEVDVAIEAADAYRQMLTQFQVDDLPRFEARFKQLLNENTIREVANFQAQLYREREAIRERIDTINCSLRGIDYNPGRYIALLAEPTPDNDIRGFQQALRACTEGALTGSEDEQYTETKFLEVKTIIERFKGREGSTELDRNWTRRVSDVRYWFVFSASERWREGDAEHEHYSDSGGKSGGQKEKLAYTVLAASLAYQFGLAWGEQRPRTFRFVVIDEAFGRASDESAHYGLELFRQLGLQLLIVTPLQKIHIIEPFVASVGFVHNPDGRQSLLRNLTIEEYQAEKKMARSVLR